MIEERLVNPLQPVARRLDRNRITEVRIAETRPRPTDGMLDESCSNRIAKHIPNRREEMAVLLNRKTLVPALPYMPSSPIVLVIPPHMTRHPPLHEGTQRRFSCWLHDEVKVIRHEADAKDFHRKLLLGSSEEIEEGRVVPVFAEDRRPTIPSIENMIGVPTDLSAWNPRHGRARYANHHFHCKQK